MLKLIALCVRTKLLRWLVTKQPDQELVILYNKYKRALNINLPPMYIYTMPYPNFAFVNKHGIFITEDYYKTKNNVEFVVAHEISHVILGHVGKPFYEGQEEEANDLARELINKYGE